MEGISDAGRGIVDWINNIRRGQWYSSAVVDMDSAPIEFPTFKLYVGECVVTGCNTFANLLQLLQPSTTVERL